QALLIAVGGGVVCDLGGFVAGSYMRGIAHINVATTLLCQVDAAIGGKTAVNTPLAKNAIGMFHHPRAVVLHHRALATLPDEELRCGFAEAIKQAALAPDDLFEVLAGWLAAPTGRLPPPALVLRCAAVKAEVVAADSRDEGVRQLLNFGHTVGHGLERASDYALRHGAAVSIGMHMEARAAVLRGTFPAHDLETLLAALEAAALPTVANRPFEAVWRFMQRDKKNQDGAVMMAVPRRLGSREPVSGGYTQALDEAVLREVWC
ncbi:MAG TPA: 3-dehydroquinate synthase, partial [Sorangium sp.]|nr:3-dehydroquinate synthase [Sorangium sp.]